MTLYQWQAIAGLAVCGFLAFCVAWLIRGIVNHRQQRAHEMRFEQRSQEQQSAGAQLQHLLDESLEAREQLQSELRNLQGLNATLNRDLQQQQHEQDRLDQSLSQTQTQLRRQDAEFSSYRSEAEIKISSLEGRYHLAIKTHEDDIEKYEDSLLDQIRRLEHVENQYNEKLRERDLDVLHLREEREFLQSRNHSLEEVQLHLRQRTHDLERAHKRIAQLEALNRTQVMRAARPDQKLLEALEEVNSALDSAQYLPIEPTTAPPSALIPAVSSKLDSLKTRVADVKNALTSVQSSSRAQHKALTEALGARDAQLARLQQRNKALALQQEQVHNSEQENLLLQQLTLQSQQIQSLSRLLKQTQVESQHKLEKLTRAMQNDTHTAPSNVRRHPRLTLAKNGDEPADIEPSGLQD